MKLNRYKKLNEKSLILTIYKLYFQVIFKLKKFDRKLYQKEELIYLDCNVFKAKFLSDF